MFLFFRQWTQRGTKRVENERKYIAIDLKSFYASVECVERGLEPLMTNLVVADTSRTEKTICLAVSPSLKAYGISSRARLFEVVQRLKEVNAERSIKIGGKQLTGKSVNDKELKQHEDWEVDYIAATPRMSHYIKYSTQIYQTYLKYVSAEDVHVYSIDEVFIDVTNYLKIQKKTPHEMAMMMIRDVLKKTGITATAGIGTNMYLCKIAMDIVAKHKDADSDGVRIAELDERTYREILWDHKPLTDFWRIGRGMAKRLEVYGLDTMGKIARQSLKNEEMLYGMFGVNAELLIDHAWGWEPCMIKDVKAYRPETSSLSSGQLLSCPYNTKKARVVVKEMADAMALDLVDKRLVTDQVTLTINYDSESLNDESIKKNYKGALVIDFYGKTVPKHAHGTEKIKRHTSSSHLITEAVMKIFEREVNDNLPVRRITIVANNVIREETIKKPQPRMLDLFIDYSDEIAKDKEEEKKLKKERAVQETVIKIKKKQGKNAILKGLNFDDGATGRERNKQIGGHRS